MRLRRCIAVFLPFVISSSRAALAQNSAPSQSGRPAPSAPTSRRSLDMDGATRFELQRMLSEVDDRRQRILASLEPADSVLRLLAIDSLHLAVASRPAVIEDDSADVEALFVQLRRNPASAVLRGRLLAAAEAMADHFTSIEMSLTSRVATARIARDYLERTPFAAVIPVESERPLVNAVLVTSLQGGTVPGRVAAPLPRLYLTEFSAAFSDSAFDSYKAGLLAALTRRADDIRTITKAERAELNRLQQDGMVLSRAIGQKQDDQSKLDSHIMTFAIPAIGAALVVLLLAPLLYRTDELRRSIITSGVLVELMTVFLLTAAVIILGVDGRIPAEVIGTLLGGVSGYVLGRAINPPRRV